MNSGNLTATVSELVGNSGPGIFRQSGGTNTAGFYASSGLFLGYAAGASGNYKLSGSAVLFSIQEYVGYHGAGAFTQSGGTNSVAGGDSVFSLGYNLGASGSYNLSGSAVLSVASLEYIGCLGTGVFSQSGGTNAGRIYLGYASGGAGSYTLSGQGWLNGNSEYVGYSGTGAFTQSGGTNSFPTSSLYLGYDAGASGTYNLAGSAILSGEGETVGYSGSGVFTQSGGTNTGGGPFLAALPGSSGTYNLIGGLLVLSGMGKGSGTANFNVNGGTLRAARQFSATLPMTLGTDGGGATFDTAGFSVTLFGSLSGPGSLTKIGSGMLVLAAASTFSGTTLISSGTLMLANTLALQNSTLDTSGSGTVLGGAPTLGALTGSGPLDIATFSFLTVGNNNASTTFSGMLTGSSRLFKTGSGALTMTGSNTYSGTTAVNQGSLIVNGSLVSPVAVNSGGLLGGAGSLTSVTVHAGGQLAPGDSPVR